MSNYPVTRTALILGLATALSVLVLAIGARTSIVNAADPGQSGPSLLVSDCLEVDVGEQFDLTIKASGASSLLAWEVYFAYNRHLLEIMDRDVHQLLNTGRQPNVVDVSDPVPNSTGFYRIAAADLGPGDTPKQGDVLVNLTLQAKAEGVSPSNIYRGDYNGDGSIDFGPTLTGASTGAGPQYLGDTDGDQRFDGRISSGQIAIGTGCVQPAPVLQPGESAAVPEPPGGNEPGDQTSSEDPDDPSGAGPDADPSEEGSPGETGGNIEEDVQPSPAVADASGSDATNSDGDESNANPRTPRESGIGGGIVPWLLIGLGVAAAGAGGITFYLIRAASREPY
jgi:hypothetical protein